jgi:hypothetical protein
MLREHQDEHIDRGSLVMQTIIFQVYAYMHSVHYRFYVRVTEAAS